MIEQNIKRRNTKEFFSKFGIYFVVGLCLLFFITLLIIASVADGTKKVNNPAPASSNTVVNFSSPLMNSTIYKDYNNESLVYNSTLKQWESHMCLDLIASDYTQVCAIYDGVVTNIYSNYLEGNVVEIKHNNGLVSKYASLSSDLLVKTGEKVKSGQQIGTASNSANREQNIGNYLQLTLLDENGNKVNPSNYLSLEIK